MSGRHRKPADHTRTLVRAGVAAATITGPLALSGAALAALASPDSDATWDRLAKCESTSDWQADTGNSFKGGLQFTDSTWKEFGGTQYASSADEASCKEQIAVAKEVQEEQGWKAWPTCTKKLGMR